MKKYFLIIRLAVSGILTNKFRAFLTMLGIIIGVASVILIMSLGAGANSLITNSLKKMGTNLIGVLPGASDDAGPPASAFGIVITTLEYDDAKALAKIPHIDAVAAYAAGTGEISHGTRSIDGNFRGVTPSYTEVESHQVIQGRFFTEKEANTLARVAVLGDDIKNELFPLTDPIGEKIKIKNETFKIIGILERKGSSLFQNPDNQIFVPLETAQKKLLGINHLSMIRIKVDAEENVPVTEKRVEETLRYRHEIEDPVDDDFSVRALSQALDIFNSVTASLGFFLASIAAVSLIVGGIGITNIMLMTVKERTREIGLRKALGAKPFHIRNQFILEALVLTTLGGIIGIIGGILVSLAVSLVVNYLGYSWDFVIPPVAAMVSFIVAVLIGLTFGVYPAKQAAKLNPIDSLRYE